MFSLFCATLVYLCVGFCAVFFYVTWRGNSSANFDEIWQVERASLTVIVCCRKLFPHTAALPTKEQKPKNLLNMVLFIYFSTTCTQRSFFAIIDSLNFMSMMSASQNSAYVLKFLDVFMPRRLLFRTVVPAVTLECTVCDVGSARKLLHHKTTQLSASDELAFEDRHQLLSEKVSPAVTNPFLQRDHRSLREETLAMDSSWEKERTDVVNYTLESDLGVSEAVPPREAVMRSGDEGAIDASADVSKFPSKNDL